MNRRRFITSAGSLATVGMAGCSGDTASNEPDSGSTDSDTTSNESDSDSADSEGENSEPVETVEQWLTAVDEGDTETATELMHPDSAGYPINEQQDIPPIEEIEETTLERALEPLYGEVDSETVEMWKQEVDADDYAGVYVKFSGSNEIYYPVTKNNGAWQVWGV